jgi:lon-related putative ATP-dependent protease
MSRIKNFVNWILRRKGELDPAKSLRNEPFYKFDLSENFYIRYRCRSCDGRAEVQDGDGAPFSECECGSTDIWTTRGLDWCLTHEEEFWRDFKTTADIKVPKEARKWLVGQERPMERELMEMRRWIYKKRQQQDELRNAPVLKIKDLELTLGQVVNDKAMVTLDQKTYRVHFLGDDGLAILEPGNFMKENPGPYILRVSEPGLGKTLASKILREEAPPLYREAGIELTDVLTIENPADEQRPLVRQIPCHAVQGGGCLAHRVVQQAERGAIAEQKQKQQFLYSLLMILLMFGSMIIFTGLFIMGLRIMQVGIVDAWFVYLGSYIGYIVLGSSLLFIPLFILMIAGSRIFQTNRTDMLKTPYPIVQHDDKPKYVYDATVVDSATMMGSIQWNALGNTVGLTNPLYKRVIAGLVHRAHDQIADIDEIKNMQHHTAVEMLSVMEDGESIIRNRGGSNLNTEASGILAISTADPVPADFMLVANGNMDMIHNPNSILNTIKAFFDRFNYGDAIYYEKYIDATFANQLKIIQVITDEISRFRLYPMEKAGAQRVIEYMRERSDNNKEYKIMFRAVIKVVLKSFEIALGEGRKQTTGDDVETAIVKYCDTVPEQEMTENLRHTEPFKIVQSRGSAEGMVNGLAVVGGSAGAVFPVVAETFPVSEHHHGDFVVTGTLKDESSWVQDSIKTVRTVIRKLYGIDIAKDHYTHIAFAEQKDVEGPSAGVAMALALMSRLGDPRLPADKRKPVPLRQDIAVTGTIELLPHPTDKLNVRVGAIGGVLYKVRGATDAGCKYVVIPLKNYEHTLTKVNYPCVIFGADSILGFFDLLRADQTNIEALLSVRRPASNENIEIWAAERREKKHER